MITGEWETVADIAGSFEIDPGELEGAEIIYASYNYEDYSGEAWVLYRKGGDLFEVSGSHCSCYGLEGQWEPESTDAAAILLRPKLPEHVKSALT